MQLLVSVGETEFFVDLILLVIYTSVVGMFKDDNLIYALSIFIMGY